MAGSLRLHRRRVQDAFPEVGLRHIPVLQKAFQMKVKFISYADGNMTYSLRRIGRQARRLGIFDEVILYTPDMLPAYIRQSPLMQYPRGGGYWSWKPAIIERIH